MIVNMHSFLLHHLIHLHVIIFPIVTIKMHILNKLHLRLKLELNVHISWLSHILCLTTISAFFMVPRFRSSCYRVDQKYDIIISPFKKLFRYIMNLNGDHLNSYVINGRVCHCLSEELPMIIVAGLSWSI